MSGHLNKKGRATNDPAFNDTKQIELKQAYRCQVKDLPIKVYRNPLISTITVGIRFDPILGIVDHY